MFCVPGGRRRASPIGALAAAYAEAGDFDAAVKWPSKANALYTNTGDKTRGQERLQVLYSGCGSKV
jgi:hypothetical protein